MKSYLIETLKCVSNSERIKSTGTEEVYKYLFLKRCIFLLNKYELLTFTSNLCNYK